MVMWHSVLWCSMVLYGIVCHVVVWHGMARCGMVGTIPPRHTILLSKSAAAGGSLMIVQTKTHGLLQEQEQEMAEPLL